MRGDSSVEKRSQAYLSEVSDQIRSKEAKDFVSIELDYHIKEAKREWMKKGLTETEAEEKAVEQMGSPITLGQQLNKLHRPKVDWITVSLLLTTLALGFLPLFSIGYMDNGNFLGHYSQSKVIFVFLGGLTAFGIMLINYRNLEKFGWLFYAIGVLILLTIRFFSTRIVYGLPVIQLGPITIESLMAVPFFFLAWASFINNKRLKIWHFGILFALSFYLFLDLASTSTAYIYIAMVFVMFWWSKFSRKAIVTITTLAISSFAIIGIIIWPLLEIYQKVRLLAFMNPENYPDSEGYMILLVKNLISQAGWFGDSINKQYFPEAHTNFVFASLTSYYGWLFAIALVLILSLFIVRIMYIARKMPKSYGKFLLIGAVALYSVQMITNIAMTLGFFPLISMSLPFISYGLMPILFNSFLIGIVLSVYRRKDLTTSTHKRDLQSL